MARVFPNWHEIYSQQAVAQMPWFYPELDPDLAEALAKHALASGTALDLGTGPGTQAFALAERGFRVTATDISSEAVRLARDEAQKRGHDIQFLVDDVLKSQVNDNFDVIFDRGCFHVLQPKDRARYVETVSALLAPRGHFFLKCFSETQPGEIGPYQSSPADIEAAFKDHLQLLAVKRTIYQGTLATPPQALFCSFQRQ